MSVVGELLAQVTQQGVDVWHAGPTGAFVEEEVVRWLTDLVGYPPPPSVADAAVPDDRSEPGGGAFGILTSGGVMANFLAMALARDVRLPALTGAPEPPRGRALEGIRIYTSDQAHFSIARALDELGFPPETLRVVPSGADFRLRAGPVADAIADDRAAGLRPLAICAVAGSTNTGSVDAIGELADLAERDGLWFHVDAAYGGAARLSPRLAGRVPDLARADSVTVDPHKWFFQAYDIGALVVRRRRDLTHTFHRSPEYYRGGDHGGDGRADDLEHVQLNFYQHGMEGTRRLARPQALDELEASGHDRPGPPRRDERRDRGPPRPADRRERGLRDAAGRPAALRRLLPASPGRARIAGRARRRRAAGARRAPGPPAAALEASGDGWLSTTTLRGRTFLRAGIVNYLTTEDDIDVLLATLRRLGDELTRRPSPAAPAGSAR